MSYPIAIVVENMIIMVVKKYKPANEDLAKDVGYFTIPRFNEVPEGRFSDMCPLSIMYPRIIAGLLYDSDIMIIMSAKCLIDVWAY